MKLHNTSARIITLNIKSGAVQIAPLQQVELKDDAATEAQAVLDDALKALVDDGSLIVDGKPAAPQQPQPAAQTGEPAAQGNQPAAVGTVPVPGSGTPTGLGAAGPDDPSAATSGSSKQKK